MFARIRGLRNRLKDRKKQGMVEMTPDNSGLTKEQIETGTKALKVLGLESKQHELAKSDIIIFLYAIGLNPTDDVVDSKLRGFKLHNHRHFTFGQLCHLWYSMVQDLTDEEEILRRAFQFFDKDGNGEISVTELRTTMHELGDMLTEEEIVSFMAIMDVNNDGVIGYHEFLNTLKTQAPELASLNAKAVKQSEQPESPTSGPQGRAGSAVGAALMRSGSTTSRAGMGRSPSTLGNVGSPLRTGSKRGDTGSMKMSAPAAAGGFQRVSGDGTPGGGPAAPGSPSVAVPIGEGHDHMHRGGIGEASGSGLQSHHLRDPESPTTVAAASGRPGSSSGAALSPRMARVGSIPRVDTSPPRAPCVLETVSPKGSPTSSDGEEALRQQQQQRQQQQGKAQQPGSPAVR